MLLIRNFSFMEMKEERSALSFLSFFSFFLSFFLSFLYLDLDFNSINLAVFYLFFLDDWKVHRKLDWGGGVFFNVGCDCKSVIHVKISNFRL